MKKTLVALAVLSTAITATLSARQLLCEQCVPESDCWEHLFVERCQWFVHGEFLYWGVAEGNLDYAIDAQILDQGGGSLSYRDYRIADFDFKPGFRVSASYYNCPKYWEVTTQYTWLQSSGHDQVSPRAGLILLPSQSYIVEGIPPEGFAGGSSDHELDYQLGDLYAARIFDPNPHLRMRLFGGITLGYLKQEWAIFFQGVDQPSIAYDTRWKFFGGGFRFGTTADWFWGCQMYLTSRLSFAALYGGYENRQKYTLLVGDGMIVQPVNRKYDDPRLAFHAQFAMGPSWQIPCDCWSFELFAGYEMNLWCNLNERFDPIMFSLVSTNISQTVLGMHGLTLRMTFGF